MRTRRGVCYPKIQTEETKVMMMRKKKRVFVNDDDDHHVHNCCKRLKVSSPESTGNFEFFNELPEDLVLCILSKLSSSAGCPSDFINVLLTCKKLNSLALNRQVLAKACTKSFAVKAKNWSESSHRFLEQCADAGNVEASYTLGMIRFYCLENRRSGASLMAKAAMNSYAPALYSLAVIQFNGSGGSKNDKDLRAGVALCARAAFLGHIDALRELGHCLQDGYGVRRNITEGRRFLIHANAREVASVLFNRSSIHRLTWQAHHFRAASCPLLSDFGCTVPAPEAHLANRFLTEWFGRRGGGGGGGGGGGVGGEEGGGDGSGDETAVAADDETGGLRQCSHSGCGRPETRRHEFRRCSVCGAVNYCSRACQALDWKLRHKVKCAPLEQLFDEEEGVNVNGDGVENVVVDDDDDEIMNAES